MALACFHLEQYAAAVEHCEAALAREPERKDWQELRLYAEANAVARVAMAGPELRLFDRAEALAPPTVPPGVLPSPARPRERSLLRRALVGLGSGVGFIGATLFGLLTRVTADWRAITATSGRTGTGSRMSRGILTLAYMRERAESQT